MKAARATNRKTRTQGSPRLRLPGSARLNGRGAVVALFAVSFLVLLVAARTGWNTFADVMFVIACGLVACYARAGGLRRLVVCPPLAFCAGVVLAQVLTAPDGFLAAERILVTLGNSALWLFAGTALTAAIALGRGYRPEILEPGDLRDAAEDLRPHPHLWRQR